LGILSGHSTVTIALTYDPGAILPIKVKGLLRLILRSDMDHIVLLANYTVPAFMLNDNGDHGDSDHYDDGIVMVMVMMMIILKLAPYGTDGRLLTTDVSAKFKVT